MWKSFASELREEWSELVAECIALIWSDPVNTAKSVGFL
jgi:hypothetical protein